MLVKRPPFDAIPSVSHGESGERGGANFARGSLIRARIPDIARCQIVPQLILDKRVGHGESEQGQDGDHGELHVCESTKGNQSVQNIEYFLISASQVKEQF